MALRVKLQFCAQALGLSAGNLWHPDFFAAPNSRLAPAIYGFFRSLFPIIGGKKTSNYASPFLAKLPEPDE